MPLARTLRKVRASSSAAHSLVASAPKRKGKTKREYPRGLARKLRQIRTRAKLSQGEIARKLDVNDRARISQFESGKRQPSLPVLLKYARLAKVTVDVLIDDKVKLP